MKHARKPALLLIGLLLLSSCAATAKPEPPDTSSLSPFQLDEKSTRFYSETMLELIPRDDYGPIYPYVGGVTVFDWGNPANLYGFCDAVGRILCDPAYRSVMLREYEGKQVYIYRKATGRYDPRDRLNPECKTMYLAAADGRFVLEFEDVLIGGEGTFAVRRDGKWGSVDFDGRELLPCVYAYSMVFSEGLAAVGEGVDAEYRYVDRQNRTVLGPYPPPAQEVALRAWGQFYNISDSAAFHDGRAAFYQYDRCGFIDRTGAVVIEAKYATIERYPQFQNGRAIVSTEVGWEQFHSALIDTDGNEIFPMGELDISLEQDKDGGIYRIYDEINESAWFIDRDGNVLFGPFADNFESDRFGYAVHPVKRTMKK